MKFLIPFLLFSLTATADTKKSEIILTDSNSISLRGEVNEDSISEVIVKLAKNNSPIIYLYINSPGGEVLAGMKLVNYLKYTSKHVVCIAEVAISMAHQILQACPERTATDTSILMQHRMSGGAQGNSDQIASALNILVKLEEFLDIASAKRMKISLEEFMKKVSKEWWVFGKDAKDVNMVDRIVTVQCEDAMYSISDKKTIQIFIFQIPILLNHCPILPVRIDSNPDKAPKEILEQILSKFNYTKPE